jgi:hypothetical protein
VISPVLEASEKDAGEAPGGGAVRVRQMRFEGLLAARAVAEATAEMLGAWSRRSGVGAIGWLRDRRIGKLSSRKPSTIKGRVDLAGQLSRACPPIVLPITAGACRSGRTTCESSMACSPPLCSVTFGMGRRMRSLIAPKDIVGYGWSKFTFATDIAISPRTPALR